jgi:hypothetical protein
MVDKKDPAGAENDGTKKAPRDIHEGLINNFERSEVEEKFLFSLSLDYYKPRSLRSTEEQQQAFFQRLRA